MAEAWASDMVLTELRRAYPEAVGKADLQGKTGMAAGDLRDALADLVEHGRVSANDEGWTWVDPDEAQAIGQPFSAPDEDESGGEDPPDGSNAPEDAAEGPVDEENVVDAEVYTGEAADTRYSAAIILEVGYHPELALDEEPDEAAVREASVIAQAAIAGIAKQFPSLPVSISVAKVEAFDNPRRVFPPEGPSPY